MDEEEYVAKVEKIIERDFFPELDKLKAQVKSREVGSQPIKPPTVIERLH